MRLNCTWVMLGRDRFDDTINTTLRRYIVYIIIRSAVTRTCVIQTYSYIHIFILSRPIIYYAELTNHTSERCRAATEWMDPLCSTKVLPPMSSPDCGICFPLDGRRRHRGTLCSMRTRSCENEATCLPKLDSRVHCQSR
jgi:hypothetical protein